MELIANRQNKKMKSLNQIAFYMNEQFIYENQFAIGKKMKKNIYSLCDKPY